MKILDLPEVTSVEDDQVMVVDGGGLPTSIIKVGNLNLGSSGEGGNIITKPEDQWIYHRNTYRGKNLGTIYTEEQKEMIRNNTFDDLYIGDYWTIGNFDWIIADINYWMNTGDTEKCTTPHLVIISKTNLYATKMNETNTTNGGYMGSKLYTQNINNAKNIIYTVFGENKILSHQAMLTNAVTNGYATGSVYTSSKVEIMNQPMVVGSMIFPGSPSVGVACSNYTIDKTQLSLFKLNPFLILSDNAYYLRDVSSSTSFTAITNTGNIHAYQAGYEAGVRPVFGLIG